MKENSDDVIHCNVTLTCHTKCQRDEESHAEQKRILFVPLHCRSTRRLPDCLTSKIIWAGMRL
jgi:hypothetical protein